MGVVGRVVRSRLPMCCGWVPCFLVSRPFRSRDEFLLLYGVTRCISWSDSHEVTTFLTLDNVYILVCTDCLVLSDVYIPLVVRIGLFRPNKRQFTGGLHLTVTSFCCWTVAVG